MDRRTRVRLGAVCSGAACLAALAGCTAGSPERNGEWAVRGAIARYAAERAEQLSRTGREERGYGDASGPQHVPVLSLASPQVTNTGSSRAWVQHGFENTFLTLGTFGGEEPMSAPSTEPTSQPASAPAKRKQEPSYVAPEGYWRQDIWHQMGHEAKALATHDFWHGFKTSYWDLENALVLTATMGASITIRGTGVDDTVRNRTDGSHALGDMDETIQIIGHPATHFAAAGVLWLGSALAQDVKEHEVAKALTQALAVNGVSTLLLKAATNTRTPDGEHFGWPSGHTSSAFAAAAVLNEYYGPWVGIPSLGLAGLVGFQRLDSRVHDFSDVVFGGMLGYIIGTSIARDDKAHFPEVMGMTVIPYVDPESGASGLALVKQW